MIIIVNKSIIDTEKIYQITEIKQSWSKLHFEIYFYNTVVPIYVEKFCQVITVLNDEAILDETQVIEFKNTHKQLIDLWSNNQSKLPNFQF